MYCLIYSIPGTLGAGLQFFKEPEVDTNIETTAASCTTAEEAKALYDNVSPSSEVAKIYLARWTELAIAEAPARAAACTTLEEAALLYRVAIFIPPRFSETAMIYQALYHKFLCANK